MISYWFGPGVPAEVHVDEAIKPSLDGVGEGTKQIDRIWNAIKFFNKTIVMHTATQERAA